MLDPSPVKDTHTSNGGSPYNDGVRRRITSVVGRRKRSFYRRLALAGGGSKAPGGDGGGVRASPGRPRRPRGRGASPSRQHRRGRRACHAFPYPDLRLFAGTGENPENIALRGGREEAAEVGVELFPRHPVAHLRGRVRDSRQRERAARGGG